MAAIHPQSQLLIVAIVSTHFLKKMVDSSDVFHHHVRGEICCGKVPEIIIIRL